MQGTVDSNNYEYLISVVACICSFQSANVKNKYQQEMDASNIDYEVSGHKLS